MKNDGMKNGNRPDGRSRAGLFVLLPILSGACWGVAGVFVRVFSAAGLDNPTIVFTRTAVCALLTFVYIMIRDLRTGQRVRMGAQQAVKAGAQRTDAGGAWPEDKRGAQRTDKTEGHRTDLAEGQQTDTVGARRADKPGGHPADLDEGKQLDAAGARPSPRLLYMRLRDIPIVLASAVFGSVVLMIAYNIAVTSLSLSLAAILLCTAPVFVLLISTVLFREKITRKKVLCMLLAIFGCALLSGAFSGGGLQWSIFGLMMGVAAALCNAVFIIMSKLIATRGYSPFTVSFYAALFASLILLPMVDWSTLLAYLQAFPLQGPALILAQSICTSLMPSLIYIVAMKHVEAGRVAILQSGAEPTAAFLAGLILYAEVPTVMGLAGMVITIIALSILSGGKD